MTDQATAFLSVPIPDLPPEELEALTEPERLGLLVGATYGRALVERDLARTQVKVLMQACTDLVASAKNALGVDALAHPTWAQDERAAARLRSIVEAVESLQATIATVNQED